MLSRRELWTRFSSTRAIRSRRPPRPLPWPPGSPRTIAFLRRCRSWSPSSVPRASGAPGAHRGAADRHARPRIAARRDRAVLWPRRAERPLHGPSRGHRRARDRRAGHGLELLLCRRTLALRAARARRSDLFRDVRSCRGDRRLLRPGAFGPRGRFRPGPAGGRARHQRAGLPCASAWTGAAGSISRFRSPRISRLSAFGSPWATAPGCFCRCSASPRPCRSAGWCGPASSARRSCP